VSTESTLSSEEAVDLEVSGTPAMRTLLGAALIGSTGTLVAALLGVARTKALALELEPSGLGLYGQILSLLTAMSVASGLGLGLGTTRLVAQARTRGDRQLLGSALSVSLALPFVAAIVIALLLAAASPLLAPALLGSDRELLIVLAAVCIPFVALQGPLVHALQGFRDVAGAQRANVLFAVVLTLATGIGVVAAGLNGAVMALVAGQLAYAATAARRLNVLARAANATVSLREGLRRDLIFAPAIKGMMAVGVASLAVGVLAGLGELAVRTALLQHDSASGAGIFQALYLVSNQVVGVIVVAVVFYTFTAVTEAHASDDAALVSRSLDDAVRLTLLLTLPVILAIGLLRNEFVGLLLSEEFGPAADLLPAQLTGDFLRTVAWALGSALVPLGLTRIWVLIGFSSAGIFALLGLVLVPRFELEGAVSAYIGMWAVSLLLTGGVLIGRGFYRPGARTLAALAAGVAFIVLVAVHDGGRGSALALTVAGSGLLLVVATSGPERRALVERLAATLRDRRRKPGDIP
jgi:PST family polysaccharide transporter/antigen flippase